MRYYMYHIFGGNQDNKKNQNLQTAFSVKPFHTIYIKQ